MSKEDYEMALHYIARGCQADNPNLSGEELAALISQLWCKISSLVDPVCVESYRIPA